jgi:tetratricopeptide (TPR) repeat protein
MVKIGGQGLLAADRPAVARLHDIVYASLKVQNWLTADRVEHLNGQLEEHLSVLIEEESLALRVFATTMRRKLEALVATGSRSPAVLTALLEIWEADEVDVATIGDPKTHVALLEARGGSSKYAEIRFILEAIESLYRRDKLQSVEVAKTNYAAHLPLFERLLALDELTPQSHAEVLHHWGKAFKVLGNPGEAQVRFEAVMSGPVPLNSTRLQLVRLYKSEPRAGVLADEILMAAGTPGRVTASVILGVVEDLSWAKGPWLGELFDKHGDLIEREILGAADAGLEQAYSALASIGRHWSWREPERMLRVASKLPMPSVTTARDRTSGALGEIFAKTAKAAGNADRDMQERALQFFDSIRAPDDFLRQKHAEALIDVDRFADAEAVLRPIDGVKTRAFPAHRLSQARLGQGDPAEALTLIDAALAALTDKQQMYLATFLAHRWRVRQALGDPQAVDDLDRAIVACEPGKYRSLLEAERRAIG